MPAEPTDGLPALPVGNVGAWLDQIRRHPDWSDDQRDAVVNRLVERFTPAEVVAGVRSRLGDLAQPDGEALLRLVEAYPEPGLLRELAVAVERQPDLPPERAWEALAVLDAAGALETSPALLDRWEALNELIAEGHPVDELIEALEEDPGSVWLALQGMDAIEPDVRAEIVAGLVGGPAGSGVVEFARLLAYAHHPPTRASALEVLESLPPDTAELTAAWTDLSLHHPDPSVANAARRHVGATSSTLAVRHAGGALAGRSPLFRSLVSVVDGRGEGTVILASRSAHGHVVAAFHCSVTRGVVGVFGGVSAGRAGADTDFEEFAARVAGPTVADAHDLATGLLAGSLLVTGADGPPSLRYWVEATLGPAFEARPFPANFPDWDPERLAFEEVAGRARDVLDACPDWLDDSELTAEIAEEILLREGNTPPDPKRDAGAYRFLFEHRLRGRLETYQRMLLWAAWFWKASGEAERARSALGLSWQLADPQHAVPGHPFIAEFATRSIAAAQSRLSSTSKPGGPASRA